MVYRRPEDGVVPLKNVGENKELYCYVYMMCICWFAIGKSSYIVQNE